MILVEAFTFIDTAENCLGQKVLDDSERGLENDENNRQQAEDAVSRDEMGVSALVNLNDNECSEE